MAKDRSPIDNEKINEVLAFLATKLSEDDFASVTDMLDDVIDGAEQANPTRAMASDGMSVSTRRIVRRSSRAVRLGFDARPAGIGMALDAQREATIKAVLPNHGRLSAGGSVGYAAPIPPKPSRPVPATSRAEVEREFPNMFKGN